MSATDRMKLLTVRPWVSVMWTCFGLYVCVLLIVSAVGVSMAGAWLPFYSLLASMVCAQHTAVVQEELSANGAVWMSRPAPMGRWQEVCRIEQFVLVKGWLAVAGAALVLALLGLKLPDVARAWVMACAYPAGCMALLIGWQLAGAGRIAPVWRVALAALALILGVGIALRIAPDSGLVSSDLLSGLELATCLSLPAALWLNRRCLVTSPPEEGQLGSARWEAFRSRLPLLGWERLAKRGDSTSGSVWIIGSICASSGAGQLLLPEPTVGVRWTWLVTTYLYAMIMLADLRRPALGAHPGLLSGAERGRLAQSVLTRSWLFAVSMFAAALCAIEMALQMAPPDVRTLFSAPGRYLGSLPLAAVHLGLGTSLAVWLWAAGGRRLRGGLAVLIVPVIAADVISGGYRTRAASPGSNPPIWWTWPGWEWDGGVILAQLLLTLGVMRAAQRAWERADLNDLL